MYFDTVRDYLVSSERRKGISYEAEGQGATKKTLGLADSSAADAHPQLVRAMVERLRDYFDKDGRFGLLKIFLHKQAAAPAPVTPPVSLRILEFLCTDNGVALQEDCGVTDDYQHMLKAHSKAFFDVFARGERFDFTVNGDSVKTTVGQLQFFRWAMERGLLQKVEQERDHLRREARGRKTALPRPKPGVAKPRVHRNEKRHRVHQLVARVSFDGPFRVPLEVPKYVQ